MFNTQRQHEETEEEYLWRLGQAKDSGLLDMTWEQLTKIINKEFRKDETEYRTESAYRKKYSNAKKFNSDVFEKNNRNEDLDMQLRELKRERIKLQTEKLQYNKWLREEARDELILEKIKNAVAELPLLTPPPYIQPVRCNRSYLLCFSDCHYGIEFSIKDLFGNILNQYGPDIFEERMWDLLNQTIEIIQKNNINELSVWELGDGIQGLLRLNSQLMQLRYGVIESAIRYGNFLGHWLNELSKYVRVKFQMTMDSNHNQLRLCGAPKNAFVNENMSQVIMLAIEKELKNNPNVIVINNPTGLNFGQFSTYQVLGIHGEVKNLGSALDNYSRAYQTPISYIVGAHIHHSESKEVGMMSEAISIRSIIGIDPYGISLPATANAGASLFEFDQLKGIICEHKLIVA